MRALSGKVTLVTLFGAALLGAPDGALAVEPGVDIAAPRVAISQADGSTLKFVPAVLTVEQGDHVRWSNLSGTHTTTSGSPCLANGLWNASLSITTPLFTRQFIEAPGPLPYFCSPHCGLGMTGQVNVTTLIDMRATDSAGMTLLTWAGGGGTYRVFRSTAPPFAAATTTVLTGAAGTTQTSFLDAQGGSPASGQAFFYLVMNQF